MYTKFKRYVKIIIIRPSIGIVIKCMWPNTVTYNKTRFVRKGVITFADVVKVLLLVFFLVIVCVFCVYVFLGGFFWGGSLTTSLETHCNVFLYEYEYITNTRKYHTTILVYII